MNDHESLLNNFLSSIISTLDADEIFDITMRALAELLEPSGLLLTFRQKTNHIYDVTRGMGDISYKKNYCVPSDTLMEEMLTADSYVPVDESSSNILNVMTSRKKRWLEEQNIIAFYTLKYNHAIIGFIYIARHDHAPLSESQIAALRKICYYTSYALRNANLYQNAYHTSITDELTSLYNRKHAFECIGNCCSDEAPASLILLDIDDFKLYNELYSVREGDRLLHLCAQIILQELSDTDKAFRFGADEFLILKNGNDTEEAKALAERIIARIESSQSTDKVWDISITCGISTFPDVATDAHSFLHNVEQAVYYSKLEGKVHMSVYRHGMEDRSLNPDIRAAYERVAPTVYALTAAIDAKDNYTFIHSMNVSKYAVVLAEDLDMNANEIEIVRDAGMLHDIGKISIPESILAKTARLTNEEYEIMKSHVTNSISMIRHLPSLDYVIPIAISHHERYDGRGYPRQLAGENIPVGGRVLCIADSFDAMCSRRPYKKAMPIADALEEIERNLGKQFDPAIGQAFVDLVRDGTIKTDCYK